MTVHGDDIVKTIRDALAGNLDSPGVRSKQAPSQTEVRMTPNPENGWPKRDGRLVFDCVGRDWIRAFRVTVEVLPTFDDVRGELGSDEWVVDEVSA